MLQHCARNVSCRLPMNTCLQSWQVRCSITRGVQFLQYFSILSAGLWHSKIAVSIPEVANPVSRAFSDQTRSLCEMGASES